MLQSKLFAKTQRAVAGDIATKGLEYLFRGGFIKESVAGRYYLLPLGLRVQQRMQKIIREELSALDAQEMLAPTLHPRELWAETNRTESVSFELMGVKDRRGRDFVLGGTAEEMFVDLVRKFEIAERELPICLYQFSTKFRDELRARGGLLRAREFLMKDAYSFHPTVACMQSYYAQMAQVYQRIYVRFGLDTHIVTSDNGYMGGSVSHEFIVEHAAGESVYFSVDGRREAEHLDVAQFERQVMNADEPLREREERVAERGPTIADGVSFYQQPSWRQIKSLVYRLGSGEFVLVALRGDLELNEAKLARALDTLVFRLATNEEVQALGSVVGFVSPLKLHIRKVGDLSLTTVRNFSTGADQMWRDTLNVNYGRDFECEQLYDLAAARDGDRAIGGGQLRLRTGIEVGNIFQLGTYYTEKMKGAEFSARAGGKRQYVMACYGIGIGRTLQTIAEMHHDECGVVWPKEIAPFDAHIVSLVEGESPDVQKLYRQLRESGLEVLLDDRDSSAGVKFSDADLIGAPQRLIVSKKTLAQRAVEHSVRTSRDKSMLDLDTDVILKRLQ